MSNRETMGKLRGRERGPGSGCLDRISALRRASPVSSSAAVKAKLKAIEGSVVAPLGFRASGVFCDIKRLGTGKGSDKGQKRDLTLIVSDVPCSVAGMFTTNQICAAPVKVCVPRVKKGIAQAIVVNSGNANACTGKQGMKDARAMTALVAKQLHIPDEHILVGSTGRIGVTLPMANVREGILAAAQLLSSMTQAFAQTRKGIEHTLVGPVLLATHTSASSHH